MEKIRIQKALSDWGVASRRAIEEMVIEGKITVNGDLVNELPFFVDPEEDDIRVNDIPVRHRPPLRVYYLLHKPRGAVCAATDSEGRPKAVDMVPSSKQRLYTIGGLDPDSSGLVILTNDGELTKELTDPRRVLEMTYELEVDGRLNEEEMNRLKAGVFLDNERVPRMKLKVLHASPARSQLEIRISETRNRVLRRVFHNMKHKIRKFKRVALGPIEERGLKLGHYRPLLPLEIRKLRNALTEVPLGAAAGDGAMHEERYFLALDLGAESGRGELVCLRDGRVAMHEISRFPNRPVPLAGTLHWDFPGLFAHILECLRLVAQANVRLAGVGVDTWGVDFGLVGPGGELLGNPVCYRDKRTNGILDRTRANMPLEEIWAATGLSIAPLNTLCQLQAMSEARSPLLACAERVLMMPDLLGFYLTGDGRTELSSAQTSQLVGTDCRWCEPIIERFGFKRGMFSPLIEPGTIRGPLRPEIAQQSGLDAGTQVIATAGHDTSAAVAAVPAEGDKWAFLSCGTWSIIGCLVDKPLVSPACYAAGFTNEYTLGGWYLARNIIGLWLVQQLRHKWNRHDDPWDYARMTEAAAGAPAGWSGLVNVADPSLLAPADMEQALLDLLAQSGQGRPAERGQLVRAVLESLALEYALRIDMMEELTGRRPEKLYMVGGGIANHVLCQLTANACHAPVYAGVEQCSAVGNALVQAMAVGAVSDRQQIRQVVRDSFQLKTYLPADTKAWSDKRRQYRVLVGR